MLSLDEYDKYCATLPHTNMVVQWGDSHVWKVDTKVFAVGGWGDGSLAYFTFKVSPQCLRLVWGCFRGMNQGRVFDNRTGRNLRYKGC